jgi:hypothetical protein
MFDALKVSCPNGTCRIVRASSALLIKGEVKPSATIFSKESFESPTTRIIKVKLSSRKAWRGLTKGAKSGLATVAVTVASSNGLRNTVNLRFGLKR